MFKFLTAIILSILFFQTAHAQKDTVTILMNNKDMVVKNKADADYILFIMPLDAGSPIPVYPVTEYYLNGKPKLRGSIDTIPLNPLTFEGTCVRYFQNGKRKSVINYLHGYKLGSTILYYPNGKLYAIENYSTDGKCKLIECRDSLGNVLAGNGEGKWIKYDDSVHLKLEEGSVKDSLENGEWQGHLGDTARYVINYKQGIPGSGTGYDASNKAYPFTDFYVQPSFKGSITGFLSKNLHYPNEDAKNKVQGKVIVQFIIEKNGTPANFKVLRAPDDALGNEAIRVLSLSLWNPQMLYGMPVQSYFTFPISFATKDNSSDKDDSTDDDKDN